MPPLDDKQRLAGGDPEETHRPLAPELESAGGDLKDLEADESDDEFAVDDDELKEFTLADWKGQFPDFNEAELTEKMPGPLWRWMAPIASCLMGTLLAAAFAGLLVNRVPSQRQASAFLIYFVLLAPVLSFAWHWLFHLRPNRLAKKLRVQPTDPAGSEPIHPK